MNKVSIEYLVSEYDGGKKIKTIADENKISAGWVYYRLRDAGTKFRKKVEYGFKHSDESRRNMSIAKKGTVFSQEWRARIAESRKCHFNGLNGYGHIKGRKDGYSMAYVPDHPHASSDGYVMLHTILAERNIGKYIERDEVVHHINGIRNDNSLDNLMIMKIKEHQSMHMKKRWQEARRKKLCNE